ncbi:MAG: FtsX-like permease family protein [Anaerolineales bacterium]
MVLKNLLRRKGRTLLTTFGIAIGVAAIIALGAMADGIESGYNAMLSGSQADLVLSQQNSFDISYSSVNEAVGPQLEAMPEVARVSGMLQGFVQSEDIPLFFVFGYPEDSFVLDRFRIIEGYGFKARESQKTRGVPLLLGATAADTLGKSAGDTVFLGNSAYRLIGIYETGDTFEDSGAVIRLEDAQILLGKPHQVSLFYIQLKNPAGSASLTPSLRERLVTRVERVWSDLSISGTDEFADKQIMGDALKGYVWAIAGLSIVIGGVGMMNAQLMAVMERTREIGVLRAVGWQSWRVLALIQGEALVVGIAGGALGILMGWSFLSAYSEVAAVFGSTTANIRPYMIQQALGVVLTLGVVGGLYPAWRASRLQPVEALRYEGGSSGKRIQRLPIGGMAINSLWQRTSRTLLTLGAIGLTVGAILALDGSVRGMTVSMTDMMGGGDAEIILRQADIADTSLSAIDERIGKKIAAMPEVQSVSGMIIAIAGLPETPFFFAQGYEPNGYAIRRFVPLQGKRISGNRQLMLGRAIADALNKEVGDTLELSGSRYKVVGIFETGTAWEEMGGVISLRDAQILAGRPRKTTVMSVKLVDSRTAVEIVGKINAQFPEIHAALTGEFVEQMPDMQNMDIMMNAISFLAIAVGGVSVMNTMLMAVLERTREIGVLRALGWRRRKILGLIIQESLILGILGGVTGILIAFGLTFLMTQAPMVGDALAPIWQTDAFIRAILVAALLGLLGGIYPAFRATRLQPVEALRYE